jgi:uncharacterized protein (TIGR02996 family)
VPGAGNLPARPGRAEVSFLVRIDPESLLAAVLADPADDALRQVFADRLIELGDPRGELINLQYARLAGRLSEEDAQREQALLAAYAMDWLGPLGVVVQQGFEIDRGFLRACVVPHHRRAYNIARVAGHPLWATVEHFAGPPQIFLHEVMRSLRSVTPAGGFLELCAGGVERPIVRLDVGYLRIESLDAHAIGLATALPRLTELVFRSHRQTELRFLLDAPVADRLERLIVEVGDGLRPPLTEWLRDASRARIPVIILDASRWYTCVRYELRRRGTTYDELRLTIDRRIEVHMMTEIIAHLTGVIDRVHRVDVVVQRGTGTWGGLRMQGNDAGGAFHALRAVLDRFAENTLVFA